mgnify:FL=1
MTYPEKLSIEPTKRSPWIVLEPGRIFVMGRSIIENPSLFYKPGFEWITEFLKSWSGSIKVDLGFEYINTGSIKWLYIFLKRLSGEDKSAENAEVTWYYEHGDDDMRELGSILRSLIDCPFRFVEVDKMNDEFYGSFLSKQN